MRSRRRTGDGGWPLLLLALALAASASASAPGAARADTVDLTVTTLLAGRADPRDGQLHTVVPIYESLSALATIRRPYTDGIRLVLSAWGSMTVESPGGQRWTGDIDLGYAEGSFFKRRLQVRLGRHFITGGAARTAQIDGLSVTSRLFRGLGLTGYGGVPVVPRFGAHRGDAIFGGRLFYRYSYDTELGVSFNQILDSGRMARQDLGLDGRYAPHPKVTISGYALLALREARLAEADVAVLWQPLTMLAFSADYRRTAPDLYLPLNSVFAVFSQETRDEVGGTVYLRPLPRLRLYGDYRAVLTEGGAGHRGGGKLSVAMGHKDHTSLNGEVRVFKLPQSGYVQGRLYSLHRLSSAVQATLSANAYWLDRPINGQGFSFTAVGTLSCELGSGLRLAATGMADVTPFVERRVEFLVRLSYNTTRRFREVSE